jgi:hypothetical protein
MKNIHVLKTDQPSRLWINNLLQGKLELSEETLIGSNTAQHIYITDDSEIKEGDNVILKSGRLTKAEISQDVLGFKTIDGVAFLYFQEGDKKIILTTDPNLIKDSVQAIDNEFLEWFVNNPSCENVEVEDKGYQKWINPEELKPTKHQYIWSSVYKIIIPKEEPKTNLEKLPFPELVEELANYYKEVPLVEESKKETLEEAANRLFGSLETGIGAKRRMIWMNGAKWKAEQDKNKYSDEEVLEFGKYLLELSNSAISKRTNIKMLDLEVGKKLVKDLFEQFKKK